MRRVPAELAGLEASLQSLRPGEVLAIVLPHSFLTNSGWNAYRASVMKRLELEAITTLPEATFAPFKGVARACVLIGYDPRGDGGR